MNTEKLLNLMRFFVFRFDSFEFRKFKRGPKLELGTVESNHEKFKRMFKKF